MTLRPYQQKAIDDLRSAIFHGSKRPLLTAPTGSGKTRTAAEIVRLGLAMGRKVLFLAPRRELIHQAVRAFSELGITADPIMAGEKRMLTADMAVASFDTLNARLRRNAQNLPEAQLVIVDEAHLSIAPSRQKILQAYVNRGATVVGLTATPARGDGRGLCELYNALVLGPSVRELTDLGFLVEARYFAPSAPDLAGIKLDANGDYRESELGGVMDRVKLVGDVVDNWQRLAPDRRTVVFATNCAHSRHLTEAFTARGVAAEHLDGETPNDERAAILARVASGKTQVLCNVFVASYGLDIPALDCAVLARPTKNITLFLQTIGRVLRPSPGKFDALVIDHAGAISDNGFADDEQPWSLDGKQKLRDAKAALQKEREAPKSICCPACTTMFRGMRMCPSCGHEVVPAGKPIPVHKADLHEVKRKTKNEPRIGDIPLEDKAGWLSSFKGYALERGHKLGSAFHKFRERFGHDPGAHLWSTAPPEPPAANVKSWVQSREIAYRAAKMKSGDARLVRRFGDGP